MEHPDQAITLSTCTVYNSRLNPQPTFLTFCIKNIENDILISKTCSTRVMNKQLRVSLGLKVTFTQQQHQITMTIYVSSPENDQKMLLFGEFSIDLIALSRDMVQFFQINQTSMIKICTQSTENRRKTPPVSHSNHHSNEQFIQVRENFLERLKHRENPLNRSRSAEVSFPLTPEFTKEPFFGVQEKEKQEYQEEKTENKYKEEMTEKIRRLLTKTRQIREEELQTGYIFKKEELGDNYEEEEVEFRQSRLTEIPSGTSLSRVRSYNQLSRERSNYNQPLPQQMMGAHKNIEYHHHYHIYRPINTNFPTVQKSNVNRKGYFDFQNHCRTNDSESLSNYNQEKGYMNAKYPFKFD